MLIFSEMQIRKFIDKSNVRLSILVGVIPRRNYYTTVPSLVLNIRIRVPFYEADANIVP